MAESALSALLARIEAPDPRMALRAQARLDRLTKPAGSLGRLEELAVRAALITGSDTPRITTPVIFTLAGDHGVVVEGVSAYPQAVTAQMVENLCRGGAAVNVLARQAGAGVVVADLGVAAPLPLHPHLVSCKVASGTANLAIGPAMSREQALAAITAGVALVDAAAPDCVGTGEMGIGNTTAASALTAALTGTGIDDAGWARKVAVVRQALATNRADPRDPLAVLAALGGFEIAGLVGVVLAGAARRVPVVLDGFIATAAALVAVRIHSETREYLLAAHRSAEPGHRRLLETLGLAPYLDLGMRLGEGTGAALGIALLRAALACYAEMATFKDAGVSERLP
jgi:nicotinate-nucleotide--dimethylbenzimidazole phosphoribosyltransferase